MTEEAQIGQKGGPRRPDAPCHRTGMPTEVTSSLTPSRTDFRRLDSAPMTRLATRAGRCRPGTDTGEKHHYGQPDSSPGGQTGLQARGGAAARPRRLQRLRRRRRERARYRMNQKIAIRFRDKGDLQTRCLNDPCECPPGRAARICTRYLVAQLARQDREPVHLSVWRIEDWREPTRTEAEGLFTLPVCRQPGWIDFDIERGPWIGRPGAGLDEPSRRAVSLFQVRDRCFPRKRTLSHEDDWNCRFGARRAGRRIARPAGCGGSRRRAVAGSGLTAIPRTGRSRNHRDEVATSQGRERRVRDSEAVGRAQRLLAVRPGAGKGFRVAHRRLQARNHRLR